jgi:hypothetical protein
MAQRFPFIPFVLSLLLCWFLRIKVATVRALAPLRRIVSRELKVFTFERDGVRPACFVVRALLECGHSHTEYGWSFRDLLYAYADPVDSPHVTARRHRCHECRDMALSKKPSASVRVIPSRSTVIA